MKKKVRVSKYHRRPSIRRGSISVSANDVDAHTRELSLLNKQLQIERLKTDIEVAKENRDKAKSIALQERLEAAKREQDLKLDAEALKMKKQTSDDSERAARLQRLQALQNINIAKGEVSKQRFDRLKGLYALMPWSAESATAKLNTANAAKALDDIKFSIEDRLERSKSNKATAYSRSIDAANIALRAIEDEYKGKPKDKAYYEVHNEQLDRIRALGAATFRAGGFEAVNPPGSKIAPEEKESVEHKSWAAMNEGRLEAEAMDTQNPPVPTRREVEDVLAGVKDSPSVADAGLLGVTSRGKRPRNPSGPKTPSGRRDLLAEDRYSSMFREFDEKNARLEYRRMALARGFKLPKEK